MWLHLKRKYRHYYKKKTAFVLFTFLCIGMISIGYAFLSTTLTIEGVVNTAGSKWDIHFENIEIDEDSITAITEPTISNSTTINFSTELQNPGDIYKFTVDIVNDGTFDAMIDSIEITPQLTAEQQNYFEYIVRYTDEDEIKEKDKLPAGGRDAIYVYLKYLENEDNTLYPSEDMDFDFSITINYVQADDTSISRIITELEKPTFQETENGVVQITYPSGCTNKIACSYTIDGTTTEATSPVTVMVGKDTTITATTSHKEITESNSYQVVRNIMYVSNSGSDTDGYGTLTSPYQTLSKAYSSTTSTKASTIYLLDNITQESTLTMNEEKDITLTSYEPSTSIKTVTRGTSHTSYLINNQNGTLRLQNITIDGNGSNVSASSCMIYVQKNTYVEAGATIQNAKNTNDYGGAFAVEGGTLTINDGTITNNTTSDTGGSAVFVYGSANNHVKGYVIMNGGTVSNNTSQGGTFWMAGEMTMNGGTITGNSSNYGGGVSNHGTFTMTNGLITNNNASLSGGGVYIAPYSGSSPVFNMTGGSITNNTASLSGGGTYYRRSVTYNVNGGTITGNSPNNEYRSIF